MKPINAAQRRGQFLRFVLLFLLAMTPVVVFMYLLGRNDSKAYEALKNERNELHQKAKVHMGHAELVGKVARASRLFQQSVFEKEPDFLGFTTKVDGVFLNAIRDLEEASDSLKEKGGGASSDKELVAIAQDYAATSKKLLEVYVGGFAEIGRLRKDYAQCDKSLTEKTVEVTALTTSLENCKRSR
ncbi:MAG: hypothetical protein R2815_11530 [Flavobacteriales bacterium]